MCLGLDPAMSWTLSQRLMQRTAEHEAIEVIEIRQNMTGMSPATKQLELLLRKGRCSTSTTRPPAGAGATSAARWMATRTSSP